MRPHLGLVSLGLCYVMIYLFVILYQLHRVAILCGSIEMLKI